MTTSMSPLCVPLQSLRPTGLATTNAAKPTAAWRRCTPPVPASLLRLSASSATPVRQSTGGSRCAHLQTGRPAGRLADVGFGLGTRGESCLIASRGDLDQLASPAWGAAGGMDGLLDMRK